MGYTLLTPYNPNFNLIEKNVGINEEEKKEWLVR